MKVRLYLRGPGIWWASWTQSGATVRRSTRCRGSEGEARAIVASWGHVTRAHVGDRRGYVYYAEAVGTGFVKIGWTRIDGLTGRMSALQTACPFEVRVLTHRPGSRSDERFEHARWAHVHVRGEWFRLGPGLRRHIHAVNHGWSTPWQAEALLRLATRTRNPGKTRKK